MKYRVAKRFKFSAGHFLPCLPEIDPCSRVHGHTWYVEIVLKSDNLNKMNMVVHFDEIRNTIGRWIDENLEHRLLNDIAEIPTTEKIAEIVYMKAKEYFSITLEKVRIEEGPNNWAEVSE